MSEHKEQVSFVDAACNKCVAKIQVKNAVMRSALDETRLVCLHNASQMLNRMNRLNADRQVETDGRTVTLERQIAM